MAKNNLLIEALNLDIGYPVKEKTCSTHKFGLMSEPESMFGNSGDHAEITHLLQLNLKSNGSIDAMNIPDILTHSASPTLPLLEEGVTDTTWLLNSPNNRSPDDVNIIKMSSCEIIDVHHEKVNIEHLDVSLPLGKEQNNDHFVPEKPLVWEDDQESIDNLWNEMSSGHNTSRQNQSSLLNTNLAVLSQNDDEMRQVQNEMDKNNYMLPLTPSTIREIDESEDMFSQIYCENIKTKIGKKKAFFEEYSVPCAQTQSKKSFSTRSIRSRAINKRDAFETIGKIIFAESQSKRSNKENDMEISSFSSFNSQQHKSSDYQNKGLHECEFENTYGESPTKSKAVSDGESDSTASISTQLGNNHAIYGSQNDTLDSHPPAGITFEKSPTEMDDLVNEDEINFVLSVCTQVSNSPIISASQNNKQDEFEMLAEFSLSTSPKAIIDINDEEIDAAIENYVNTQGENAGGGFGHPKTLEKVSQLDENNDASTQTTIRGSIYSSANRCSCVKSSGLKRSLEALSLEYLCQKKSKTNVLSPTNYWDESPCEQNVSEAVEFCREKEISPGNEIVLKNDTSNKISEVSEAEIEFLEVNSEKEKMSYDNDMEQAEYEDEPLDQEVPRNAVVIGMLPILPPANFSWEIDEPDSIGNDIDLRDPGTPKKSTLKTPRRLRLGLSKRAKPRLPLHRVQQFTEMFVNGE